jgi:hypothetical protein
MIYLIFKVLANSKALNGLQGRIDSLQMDLTLNLAKCFINLGRFEESAEKATEVNP